jgi:AraC-like DNA-binding protein
MAVLPIRPSAQDEVLRATQLRLLLTSRSQANASNWTFSLGCPFWRIYVNKTAGAFIQIGKRRLDLRPGRVYCIPAWLEYRTGVSGVVEHDYVHFEWSGISAGWLRHCIPEPVELPLEGALAELCARWQEGLGAVGPLTLAQHVWTQAWIYAVVGALLAQGGGTLQAELLNRLGAAGRLRPALEHMDRNLAAPPANPELAKRCGMSTDHFIKRFKETLGSTPAQYQMDQRINQAAQWLAGTELKLEEIAARAGFTDRFHFSRAFRVRLRESPAGYRRKFRATRGVA